MNGKGGAASPLPGLMQDWPLTLDRIIDHAARWHGHREIVSRLEDGTVARTTYKVLREDAIRLSNALIAYGIAPGDRVATLAMNGAGHLAAWYGISGIGAVCHTLNPRYADEQLQYIIKHAGDRLIFADGAFAPLVERLRPSCPSVEKIVYFSPPASGDGQSLDDFVAGHGIESPWNVADENSAAGLCYTSGTTGKPKGALYSHRSNFLHTLMTIQPDMLNLSGHDVVLPIVPMYHANAWGMTFSGPCVGAKMVLPGAKVDGASLAMLIESEGVTFAAAVPTVWLSLIDHMRSNDLRLPTLRRVLVGGAPMPARMIEEFAALGIEAIHAWGMTEMSPVGGVGTLTPELATLSAEEQRPYRIKQGRSPCAIDLRIVDDEGRELPRDGRTMGSLQVRGPAIVKGYFGRDDDVLTADGFFDTGDIATIDEHGLMQITDRAKDIIKSGGEWISTIAIEQAALSHDAVAMAAVIGVPDPKWDERPRLFVTLKAGETTPAEELQAHVARAVPKWWAPDRTVIVDSMPLGSTGKVDKKQLRELC